MISLASGLPLLQIGDQEITDYTPQWLEDSILEAASQAGHEQWWFASDVVRSLFIYLRDRFQSSVITLEELFEKLRRTLDVLGFHDISEQLHERVPPRRISLLALARQSILGGFELEFFDKLARELEQVERVGASQVRISDLKPAVKLLCGADRWRRDCETLAKHINDFIEGHLSHRDTVTFQVH